MIVWLGEGLVPVERARIDPRDRGLLLGDGLFETVRVRNGSPRLWRRHLARLREGAGVLGLALPAVDLEQAIAEIAAANGLPDAAVRLTLTRGVGPRGIAPPSDPPPPTLLITAAPLPARAAPVRLCIARSTCRNAHSPLARLKTLNYLDGVLARREALARGSDDAVLLNTDGRAAETTAASLFLRLDGRWATPPVEEGALPGVVRAELLAAGFAEERSVSAADLERATAILLANSLGVTAGASLEGRALEIGAELDEARAPFEAM